MLPFAPRAFAETVVDGPSLHDLAHLIVGFAPLIGTSLVLGVVVGVICPRRVEWPYAVSAVVGFVVYHAPLWWGAYPNEWSWREPITSEAYQFAPAALFCAAPAILGTLVIRRLLSWRHAKSI